MRAFVGHAPWVRRASHAVAPLDAPSVTRVLCVRPVNPEGALWLAPSLQPHWRATRCALEDVVARALQHDGVHSAAPCASAASSALRSVRAAAYNLVVARLLTADADGALALLQAALRAEEVVVQDEGGGAHRALLERLAVFALLHVRTRPHEAGTEGGVAVDGGEDRRLVGAACELVLRHMRALADAQRGADREASTAEVFYWCSRALAALSSALLEAESSGGASSAEHASWVGAAMRWMLGAPADGAGLSADEQLSVASAATALAARARALEPLNLVFGAWHDYVLALGASSAAATVTETVELARAGALALELLLMRLEAAERRRCLAPSLSAEGDAPRRLDAGDAPSLVVSSFARRTASLVLGSALALLAGRSAVALVRAVVRFASAAHMRTPASPCAGDERSASETPSGEAALGRVRDWVMRVDNAPALASKSVGVVPGGAGSPMGAMRRPVDVTPAFRSWRHQWAAQHDPSGALTPLRAGYASYDSLMHRAAVRAIESTVGPLDHPPLSPRATLGHAAVSPFAHSVAGGSAPGWPGAVFRSMSPVHAPELLPPCD